MRRPSFRPRPPRFSRSRAAFVALLVFALGAPGLAGAAGFDRLEGIVTTPDHPEPRALRVYREAGVDYIEVDEMAFLVRADRIWRADEGRMELLLGDRRIAVEAGSPYVAVDETTRNLLAPAAWVVGRLVAPLALLTEVLDPFVPGEFTWDAAELVLRLDSSEANVLSVAYSEEDGGTTIVIRTGKELPARIEETFAKTSRLVVKLPGGVLDRELLGQFPGRGLVESLQTTQTPDLATLSFRLSSDARSLDAAERTTSTRLRLHVRSTSATPAIPPVDPTHEPPPAEGDETLSPDDVPAAQPWLGPGRVVSRVVLDPGHGGSDGGAASARGEREKEITLEIARRVRDALRARAPEIEVTLTREDDRYLANEDRRRFANAMRADLVVSLHCDGWFDGRRRGFAVATWGAPGIDPDRARPPSAIVVGEVRRDVDLLARSVLVEMDRALTMPSRGARQAPLEVLDGLRMPAILIECGTLTNADDRKLLVSEGFQDRLAGAIADGILVFRKELGLPPAFDGDAESEEDPGDGAGDEGIEG